MNKEGNLHKMQVSSNMPVGYKLNLSSDIIPLNYYIGSKIRIEYLGRINCINCGKTTKTSFAQGYCYDCFQTVPEADPSVMRPELNLAHLGVSRDMEWSQKNDLIDHIVYLALTNSLKVGVTRIKNVPDRWIDQGAWKVIKLAKTPNRHIAGIIENFLKKHLSDKTSWQQMLKDVRNTGIDLEKEKMRVSKLLPLELQQYLDNDDKITEITYPMSQTPDKVIGLNFEKDTAISGTLTGIRGQYLIFDNETAFNVRRHSGYLVRFSD